MEEISENIVKEEILQELEKIDENKPTINNRVYGRPSITQESEEEIALTARGRLDKIVLKEDNEPRKGTILHKQWSDELLLMYKDYNLYLGFKVFNETKID